MSFVTGTNIELIYSNTSLGTARNSFTSEIQLNDIVGMGVPAHLPPDYWGTTAQIGRGIRIVARGVLSAATGTTPTYTFLVRSGAQGNTSACILLGTTALTTSSGVQTTPFVIQGDVVLSAVGAYGANSTIRGVGLLKSPGLATPLAALWGENTTPVAAPGDATNFDPSITNYVNVNVACSASDVGNSIQLYQLLVFGLN